MLIGRRLEGEQKEPKNGSDPSASSTVLARRLHVPVADARKAAFSGPAGSGTCYAKPWAVSL